MMAPTIADVERSIIGCDIVLKMMDFVLKMMDSVLKLMDFVLNMILEWHA